MGEVYRARDTRLDRTVAIKILSASLSSNPELAARFEREARAISSLNHPHICHLYDIGKQDGTAYLVMEYLEGETLADRLRKGPLPIKQALDFAIQITEALATAHRAGILHRDLKPGNVMLTPSGAKLLDFGLAKSSSPLAASGAAAISNMTPSTPTMTIADLTSPAKALTQKGTVVGTFQYMAPEVLQGAEADARSDIFSLGCVLYEMFTGRRAFEGKSQLSVMTGILEKDPDLVSQVAPSVPPAVDHVVKTCLEKIPDERFQTVHDVKLQLKWIADGGSQSHALQPAPTHKRSNLAWILAAAALLIALASLAAYLRLAARPAPVTRTSILPPAGTNFVTMVPSSGPAVISPDGSRLAFTARDDKGKILLYVRPLTSITPQPLPGTDDATYPFWSADGRDIGFFTQGKLKRASASGGPVQTLCDASNGRGGAWNNDGIILFTPSATSPLLRVPATGGTPESATKLDFARNENSHRWPHFLPDNQHFLFWGRSSLGSEQALMLGSLGSLQPKMILKGVTTATYASGYLLFLREQTLLAQAFDPARQELSGEPIPIAEHIAINGATGAPDFSAADNGTLVYQTGEATGTWDLLWYTRDGKPAGAVAQQERYYYPALSPDDTRVAVSLFNGTQGIADVWVVDLLRGAKSRLTFGPGTQLSALWSRDNRTIYYSSNIKGINHIYSRPADGSGSEQPILEDAESSTVPFALSSDGHYLVFTRRLVNDPKNNVDIWVLPMSPDGKPNGKPFPIVQTPFDDNNPVVAPNGKYMAYQNIESGRNEVYLTTFPTGGARWQVSTNGGVDARFRGDGKELFFLDPSDSLMAVDVDTSTGTPRLGVPHALFQVMGVQRQVGTYVVTKDGRKFLVNSGSTKQGTDPLTLVTNWTAELRK
jgi:serine/threonine protein kinase